MSAGEIHLGDIGTVFRATIKENGVVVDVSSASVLKLKFRKPSGEVIEKTALLETDGTDGVIYYTTVLNDLDEVGMWRIQGYAEIGPWKGHSDIIDKRVYENLVVSA